MSIHALPVCMYVCVILNCRHAWALGGVRRTSDAQVLELRIVEGHLVGAGNQA